MPLKRTCREVAALVIAREDRALPWRERLALRLHMAACAACPRFERQVLTLRRALGAWRHYSVSEDEADAPADRSV
ncbi:zf-HC2 domain-containing protein [Tibeticola sp.]|uniref:zf-HC2 domain-containing protein n=1 Tax=Tibeticola sp. TaxID=2005368 RepID=UPI00258512AC|nr:zf-HC2 domain-containing protein [Tibeticola sp.]MCI4440246.1 zf-HC2 domain-containing protein [Tibeticola sp.]